METFESNFCIHFGTKKSVLTPDEAIRALELLKISTNEFKSSFLQDYLDLKIEILPSEEGSYRMVAVLCFIAGAFLKPLGDDFVRGFWKGLDVNTENIGESVGEALKNAYLKVISLPNSELEREIQDFDTDKKISFDRTVVKRSDFFKEMDKSYNIKFVQFGTNKIQQREYYKYILDKDIVRPLEPEYYYKNLIIKKPITLREYVQENWSFVDSQSKKSLNCRIFDNEFIEKLLSGNFPLKNSSKDDFILCKLKFEKVLKNGEEKIKDRIVTEIYSYNVHTLKPLPPDFIANMQTWGKKDDQLWLIEK